MRTSARIVSLLLILVLFAPSQVTTAGSGGPGGSGGSGDGGHGLNLTDDPVNYTQAAYQNLFSDGGIGDDDEVRLIQHDGDGIWLEGPITPGLFYDTEFSARAVDSGFAMHIDTAWSAENPAVATDWLVWSSESGGSRMEGVLSDGRFVIGTYCSDEVPDHCAGHEEHYSLTILDFENETSTLAWLEYEHSSNNLRVEAVHILPGDQILISGSFIGRLSVQGLPQLNNPGSSGWSGFHAVWSASQNGWVAAQMHDKILYDVTETAHGVLYVAGRVSESVSSTPHMEIGSIDGGWNLSPLVNVDGEFGTHFSLVATPQTILIMGEAASIQFGSSTHGSAGGDDVFILAYTPQFELSWHRMIGSGADDIAREICMLDAGHALFTGRFADTTLFPHDQGLPDLVAPLNQVASNEKGDIVVVIDRYGEYVSIKPTQFSETHCHTFAGGGFLAIFKNSFQFQGHDYISLGLADFGLTRLVHDEDMDGYGPRADAFPEESTQWSDADGDGYGDNQSEGAFEPDACIGERGTSTEDGYGCPDRDGDGWSDEIDAFTSDPTQWSDADFDGYGDNPDGNKPDACPSQSGTSQMGGVYGCIDNDGDGWSDETDPFPFVGSQWHNEDGDDYGDNLLGFNPDFCPEDEGTSYIDVHGCPDQDEDGYSDLYGDAFPLDPTQHSDQDGDGWGDNSSGNNPDAFPNNPTQWTDSDGDGYGDNPNGFQADAFRSDPTQWSDVDGDECGDNPNGTSGDMFRQDITQCEDADEDGHGDNPLGNSADHFPDDPLYWADGDGDGIPDELDDDRDNDGFIDSEDAFPDNPLWNTDTDGDTIADLVDTDDDGDGFSDSDELAAGTDPLDSGSHPIAGVTVFGIEFGVWDLVGIFGGGPVALWLAFGLATRSGRVRRYVEEMEETQSQIELEGIAQRYEKSLMLRLIGPHQGIRLERIRAERDDAIEQAEQMLDD